MKIMLKTLVSKISTQINIIKEEGSIIKTRSTPASFPPVQCNCHVKWTIICLRQIIGLPDTDKSQYFAITEFNNTVSSFSDQVCFLINIFGKLPFLCKIDSKKEKSVVSFVHKQNIICSQTQLDNIIALKQTIICRQLFAGHVVVCQLTKRKKICFE